MSAASLTCGVGVGGVPSSRDHCLLGGGGGGRGRGLPPRCFDHCVAPSRLLYGMLCVGHPASVIQSKPYGLFRVY